MEVTQIIHIPELEALAAEHEAQCIDPETVPLIASQTTTGASLRAWKAHGEVHVYVYGLRGRSLRYPMWFDEILPAARAAGGLSADAPLSVDGDYDQTGFAHDNDLDHVFLFGAVALDDVELLALP